MSVITWQNINAPTSRSIGQELGGAQQGIRDGFDILSKVIADRQGVNQGVADRARNAEAENYLNTIQGYKTPEELNTARLSGVLDQRIAALDPRNQAAVRGAADARLTSLQEQVGAANTFAVNQVNAPVALANAEATANNAPLQRNLDRIALEQKTRLEPITSATALETAKNARNAATLIGTLQPITDANARSTAQEDAARLKEVAQGRAVDADVNTFVQNYQKTSGSARDAITAVALGLGPGVVPMNRDGTLALDQMDSTKKKAFNDILITKGLPTLDILETGDTKAKATLLQQLKDKGYNVSHIARVAQGLDFSLGTGAIAPIGNDLSAFNASIAKRDSATAMIENQYGVKTEPGSVGPLLKEGLAAIDSVVPKDSARSEIYKERLGDFLKNGGIKVTQKGADGKPLLDSSGNPVTTRVLPTGDQIQVLISGINKKWHNTRGGWFGIGKSGMQEEIDNALKSWTDSPEAQKGASELTKLDLVGQLQKIRKAEELPLPIPGALQFKK